MNGSNIHNPFVGSTGALEEQAGLLAEVTQGFASSLNIEETLRNAIARFIVYLDAEAASIFLLESEDNELVCYDCAGPVDITGLRLDASQGIVGKTVRQNEPQMVRDVSQDPDFAASVDAGTGFVTRSILCAPLTVRGNCIGALELINKRSGDHLFDTHDLHLVTAIASSAALAIHNARMAAALVEQERVRKELELAREIQLDLLPAPANEAFPISGLNIPANEVSGDFYDFLELEDGRIYFSLADVSGKGMNAALLMAKTSSLLRCLAKTASAPGKLLEQVNNELCETSSHGMFVTIVTGFIEPDTGSIVLGNAGHQPPLFYNDQGAFREIPAEGPPLGVVPGIAYPETTLRLDGGSLYLFTDGVTESLVSGGAQLHVSGLVKLIELTGAVASGKRLSRIVDEIQQVGKEQRDDITLMLIEAQTPLWANKVLEMRFESDPAQLKSVRKQVKEALDQCGCDSQLGAELVLAVNEACMNIMQHAYKGDTSGEIILEILNNGGEVEFRLKDFAQPIDRTTIKPRDLDDVRPGGLGTHIISELMDEYRYEHLAGECGNHLTMKKKI